MASPEDTAKKYYAILRIAKLPTMSKIKASFDHNNRHRETSNADKERAHLNTYEHAQNYKIEAAFDELIEKAGIPKVRANACRAIEVLFAHSPEAGKNLAAEKWSDANRNFLKDVFGAENILDYVRHGDESSLHDQAIVVPILEKTVRGKMQMRLSATDFVGRPKLLEDLQTKYAEAMKPFGLERGEPGSKRKHVAMKDLYRSMNLIEEKIVEISNKANEDFESFKKSLKMPNLSLGESLSPKKVKAHYEKFMSAGVEEIQELLKMFSADIAPIAQASLIAEEKLRVEKLQREKAEEDAARAEKELEDALSKISDVNIRADELERAKKSLKRKLEEAERLNQTGPSQLSSVFILNGMGFSNPNASHEGIIYDGLGRRMLASTRTADLVVTKGPGFPYPKPNSDQKKFDNSLDIVGALAGTTLVESFAFLEKLVLGSKDYNHANLGVSLSQLYVREICSGPFLQSAKRKVLRNIQKGLLQTNPSNVEKTKERRPSKDDRNGTDKTDR